jgi:hypothetical protein
MGEELRIHTNLSPHRNILTTQTAERAITSRVLKVMSPRLPSFVIWNCAVLFPFDSEVYIQLYEAVVLTSQPPEYIGLHRLKCSGTSGGKALPDLLLTQV